MSAEPSRRSLFEAYTAHHHLRASIGQGAVAGIFLLNEYVARKGLHATRWHVLALLLAPALAQFITVAWNPTDPRRLLGKRPFRLLGIPSRLLLLVLLVPFLQGPGAFVSVLAIVTATEALLLPVQNATLARNYSEATRGRRFGAAGGVLALAIAAVAWPAGWILDKHPQAWPLLYALAALAGAYGFLHWSRLRRRARRRPLPVDEEEHASPWKTLWNDRDFLAFEACFMVYGLGFLMLQPVLPIYLVDELKVTYTQVALARGVLFWLAMMITSFLAGRLADRIGILRLGALSYLALTAFPLVLLHVHGPTALYVGFGAYGVAMAGVNIAWNLGPIMIARGRDPLPFLNAHVALVAVRAVVGMAVGTWLQLAAGSGAVFWCVTALELVAAAGMFVTARAHARRWAVVR